MVNKYAGIARTSFKEQTVYLFNNAFKLVVSIARLVLAFLLWSTLFADKKEIAGFSFAAMMTYYIVICFFKGLDSSDAMLLALSAEIREGKFTRYLVRPVNPLLYFMSSCYAKALYYFIINTFTTAVFILIFRDYFQLTHNIFSYGWVLAITLAGMNFLILLNYLIAIASFKFMEITAFNIFKNGVMEFLTGLLIPLALLPAFVRECMVFFPFYHIFYFPALLLIGKEDLPPLFSLSLLVLWNIVLLAVIKVAYGRLIKKYDGAGI